MKTVMFGEVIQQMVEVLVILPWQLHHSELREEPVVNEIGRHERLVFFQSLGLNYLELITFIH